MRFPPIPLNNAAFRVIDTPRKAYLLGFLLADGCVREPTKRSRSRVNLKILAGDIQACRMVQEIAGGNLRLIEGGYLSITTHRFSSAVTTVPPHPRLEVVTIQNCVYIS